jgi:hypothetical protein
MNLSEGFMVHLSELVELILSLRALLPLRTIGTFNSLTS